MSSLGASLPPAIGHGAVERGQGFGMRLPKCRKTGGAQTLAQSSAARAHARANPIPARDAYPHKTREIRAAQSHARPGAISDAIGGRLAAWPRLRASQQPTGSSRPTAPATGRRTIGRGARHAPEPNLGRASDRRRRQSQAAVHASRGTAGRQHSACGSADDGDESPAEAGAGVGWSGHAGVVASARAEAGSTGGRHGNGPSGGAHRSPRGGRRPEASPGRGLGVERRACTRGTG